MPPQFRLHLPFQNTYLLALGKLFVVIAVVTTMIFAIDNALLVIKGREVLIILDGDPAVYV
jgi:hypothetical protein